MAPVALLCADRQTLGEPSSANQRRGGYSKWVSKSRGVKFEVVNRLFSGEMPKVGH